MPFLNATKYAIDGTKVYVRLISISIKVIYFAKYHLVDQKKWKRMLRMA
jgi:hypothetical protein